ncbi:MAG: alkene reductase [Gammaproteobacteria bacterium]
MIPTHLLASFQLGDLTLKNRIVLAPMTRSRAGKERLANALMAEYYSQRCSAGLLISEATTISAQANGWNESPGIYTAKMRDAWKQVTDAVHAKGTPIFLQLWHMGRASHSSFHNGELPVAPSSIKIDGDGINTPLGKQPYEVPHALSTDEVALVIKDYQKAALHAKEAGFDGVEIHAANGYLIDQFLQSRTNTRKDQYGGSLENRYRFLAEVVDAVCSVWPSNRVAVRLSPNGCFNDMGSTDFREQFLYAAQQLEPLNLAYLHVMDGLAFGFHELGEPMALTEFREVYSGTLMGNCGYSKETADAAVAEGRADLIAFGRPFISNPDLVERFAQDADLNEPADMQNWYSPMGAKGYTDYPTLVEQSA